MSGHRVDIVGAGAGHTVIRPSGSSGVTTLTVAEPSSTVRGLAVGTDAGTFAEGLELSGTATRVSVAAAGGASQSLGVVLDGGTLSNSTVAAHEGAVAIGGRITAARISGDLGVGTEEGTLTVDDSLITTTPGPASEEAISDVVTTLIPLATTATLKLRHDTLIGDGSSGSSGVTCEASGLNAAADCETTIDSSVIRGFQHAVVRSAIGSGAAASSHVSIDYSDLDPSGNVNSNAGGGTGSIALGAHDLNVNPAFARLRRVPWRSSFRVPRRSSTRAIRRWEQESRGPTWPATRACSRVAGVPRRLATWARSNTGRTRRR
jgi:hypothetical protein